jgi:phosphoesterase RecJ-like protein
MSILNANAFRAAARWLEVPRRPLLITHGKPDGDALGALVAMRSILAQRGIEAVALLFDRIPGRYAVFERFGGLTIWDPSQHQPLVDRCDSVIILDTCTYNQLEPLAAWLRSSRVPKLVVDHHATRDDLADQYLIDESAAAVCLILYEWSQRCDWTLAPAAAEGLFIGIAMDTGWFRHANTDERALRAAAALTASGVRPPELYQQLFLRESPGRVRLLGAALATMELSADGRLSVMTLSSKAIDSAGATSADTEDIVNEPLRIESVAVSLLLVEQGDGVVRANFRSKPPLHAGHADIDVSELAQTFGGGGHPRAAGARIRGELSSVCEKIVGELQQRLSSAPTVRRV